LYVCNSSVLHYSCYRLPLYAARHFIDRTYTFLTDTIDSHMYKPVGFYGPITPPGPNGPSAECLPNVVPNSDFRTCPDPEFPNALHSEFMNTPNVQFLNLPLCSAPLSYLASSKWGRPLCYGHAAACWCLQRGRGCRVRTCVMAIGADFKMYRLRQFCSNRVDFLYNTQETQTQKMDQNFEIRIV